MKVAVAFFFLVAISAAQQVGQLASPKMGWKQVGAQTFALNATERKDFNLPVGRFRIALKADDAVYAGVATAEQFAPFRQGRYLQLTDFKSFHCVQSSVIESSADCSVGVAGAILTVRDKRGPITEALGAYSILHPLSGKGMADRASKANKVALTLYAWSCVENCPARR